MRSDAHLFPRMSSTNLECNTKSLVFFKIRSAFCINWRLTLVRSGLDDLSRDIFEVVGRLKGLPLERLKEKFEILVPSNVAEPEDVLEGVTDGCDICAFLTAVYIS